MNEEEIIELVKYGCDPELIAFEFDVPINEIKEKIYNDECEKIDKMVSNKIITKEKGEKLKVEVKENLQQMKRHMKRNNK